MVDAFEKIGGELANHDQFNQLHWRHFVAQIGQETDGLSPTSMRETMRFTAVARIIEVYRFRLQLCIDKPNKGKETKPAIAKGARLTSLPGVNDPELLARDPLRRPRGHAVYGGHRVHRLRPIPDHPPQRLVQRDEGDRQAARGGEGCPGWWRCPRRSSRSFGLIL